jgi:hypothetical protein
MHMARGNERMPRNIATSFATELPDQVTLYRVPRADDTQSWNVAPPLRTPPHALSAAGG